MKSLVEYIDESINESKEDVQRFKIDNLKDELESNRVSKSRISEIIKFFKTVLGDGPYYCVSENNIAGKDTLPIVRMYSFSRSITALYDLDNIPDDYEYKDDFRKHNEEISSLSKEKIARILDMEKNLELEIKPFQYGRYNRHAKMFLKSAIARYNNEYIPVIIQTEESRGYSWSDMTNGLDTTLYVACKDID